MQGPCCTNECTFKAGDKCRDDNGCRGESFCDGAGPSCPASEMKPNKTVCNDEFVCYKGECTGSICLAYGLESCQCEQGPDDADTNLGPMVKTAAAEFDVPKSIPTPIFLLTFAFH